MWFLCQRRDAQPRDQWTVTRDEHLTWMREQHEAGQVIMSGPAPDHRMSMYLIRAGSQQEAEEIAKADPFTRAGHCAFELIRWEIHQILGAGAFATDAIRAQGKPGHD